jgi:alanine racemase
MLDRFWTHALDKGWQRLYTLPMKTSDALSGISQQYTSFLTIDLDVVAANVRALLAHTGPGVEMIAVVKANAYGHGAVPVARTAVESGAHRLAVGRTDEGVQLRRAGLSAPILNLCYSLPEEADETVRYDLTATVSTIEGARALSQRAGALGKTAAVHIKVDTGMGRYGLLPDEVLPFMEQVSSLPHLDIEGMFTHFPVADEADKTYTQQQMAIFHTVLDAAQQVGYTFRLRHAANSAAVIDMPETHLDAVRPGLAIYGLYPSPEVSHAVALQPALTLTSHVARVRTLPAGSGIGYGLTYFTKAPTQVALVPIGYADGYFRLLSNRGVVLIHGQRAPIIGRVCMDQLMVDATGINVAQDDEVVLIGRQDGGSVPAEEVAELAETINYEVVTGLARRIPRVYVRDGRIVDITLLNTDCQ